MKNRFAVGLVAIAFAVGHCATAMAAIGVVGQWGNGLLNLASDNDADELLDLVSTVPGQLDIGDGLFAVVSYNTIEYAGGPALDGFFGVPGFNEWTGIAILEVSGKVPAAGGGGPYDFTFKAPSPAVIAAALALVAPSPTAVAAVAGFIPDVTTVRFYEGTALDFDREAATVAAAATTAVNDGLLFSIGFVPIAGGTAPFWTANEVVSDNVGAIGAIPLPATGGGFNFGQNLVGPPPPSVTFGLVPTFDFVGGPPNTPGLHQFGGTGSLLGTSGATTPFDAYSDTNLVFRPNIIPEPISMLVWGGLISISYLFASRRRS